MRRILPMTAAFQAFLLVHSALAADLPVREVVLFKHGVGFFQRSGDVPAGQSARLEFNAAEMDDVLKSLTVVERGGGKVSGLRYDSSDTLEHKLANFPFAAGDKQSLAQFFDQVKGARVEIRMGAETIAGSVVSGRNTPAASNQPERDLVVLFTASGDLRTIDLASASLVRFADPAQQALMRDYLGLLDQARSKEKRGVTIDSTASGARQISASYMIPAAVWKSSYRLIFADGDATLEGWAIVDNTTGEDWNGVRLAVVSGRPVSFVSKLYEPKYRERPVAELAEEASVRPMVFAGDVGSMEKKAVLSPPPAMAMAAPRPGSARGNLRAADEVAAFEARAEATPSTAAVATSARDLGDLFEYRFANPVTVRKNESAMLPFLQQKIATRKLLIYSQGMGVNPMSAAEVTNSSGKTLDGGPITVYDSNTYAGEALVETVKAGDKRLISYAIDLGTRVTTAYDSRADLVREIHFQRGVAATKVAAQETKTYTIRNVDQKAKTLIIEHAQRPGYTLLNQKATEMTPNAYRFEVKLAANATEKFAITEERVYETSTAVSNLTPDAVLTLASNKALSAEARRALEQIAAKKREIADNAAAAAQAQADLNDMQGDQGRLRQNIESLNRISGQQEQVQRYAAQLAQQETKIVGVRDTLNDLRKKKAALEKQLNDMMDKTAF